MTTCERLRALYGRTPISHPQAKCNATEPDDKKQSEQLPQQKHTKSSRRDRVKGQKDSHIGGCGVHLRPQPTLLPGSQC